MGSSEDVLVAGYPRSDRCTDRRDIRGTLDRAASGEADAEEPTERAGDAIGGSRAVVIACPPHPQYGGSRSDPRLRAVSERLRSNGIDCLRFDYGPWAEGIGERDDSLTVIEWAHERYEQVGLFGYSFGGAVGVLAAAGDDIGDRDSARPAEEPDRPRPTVAALCVLAPAAELAGVSIPDVIGAVDVPAAIVYGTEDVTVDWASVVAAAHRAGWTVTELPSNHQFTGYRSAAAAAITDHFQGTLG